jgi:crotonobetainyl-CoA:carnitine CoA-transferase CaiB-like acyl-CoA transferase
VTAIDLTDDADRPRFDELVERADVVITALEPATADRLGVDGRTLCARNPRLVHCEVTGFGRWHPLSDVAGHDGIVTAASGRAHEFGVLFDGERPAFPAVPVATHGATMLALQGIFAALVEREHTGVGQQIATSLLRALSVYELSGWTPGSDRKVRLGDLPMVFYTAARTSDGVWVQFSQNGPRLFRALLRTLGVDHLLDEPRFRTAPSFADPADARAMRALLLARVGERTWDEWRPSFDADPDVSAEPFRRPGEALYHPQLVHTGDACEVVDPEVGATRQLGPLVTFRPVAGATSPQPAPATSPAGPLLRGVTVLELSTWLATPIAAGLLAELGARVVKIEPLDGDPMRRHGPAGMKGVLGKESIALDLKSDEGREIVHRLVERADVLLHNYRPGAPERLGIDDATLRARNPGLVYLYAASYGSTGPMSARPAFHVTAGAICGGALAQCGSDGAPAPSVALSGDELAWWSLRLQRANESNPDFNAAVVTAAAVTMALYARARTGEGQNVETRMMASNAYTLSEHFVDYENRPPRPLPDAGIQGLHALHRLYRARDGWVFLAAARGQLTRLRELTGIPGDVAPHDDAGLAAHLEHAFAARDAAAWQRELAADGIAFVRAHDGTYADYVFGAPWSRELGFVAMAGANGSEGYERYGRVVETERDVGPLGAAGELGAQTRRLLGEIGYDDDEISKLLSLGVVLER